MRKLTRLLHFICFLVIVLGKVNVNRIVCDFNDEEVSNGACYIRPCGRVKCLTSTSMFLRPVDKVWIHMRLIRETNETGKLLLNYRQDFCNLTNINKGNYFATKLIGIMAKFVKSFKCPMQPGNVTVSKVPILLDFTEAFYTSGNYTFHFDALSQTTPLGGFHASFTIY